MRMWRERVLILLLLSFLYFIFFPFIFRYDPSAFHKNKISGRSQLKQEMEAPQRRERNHITGDVVSTISIDDAIGSDLLENILNRLPALCFASAACVNRTWNSICSRILSSPKLTSAISLNPSLEVAVDEVIKKVLSEPIRPQFSIAYVGPSFNLSTAHWLIASSLGSRVPVVTSLSDGIIGRDALTNEFTEIQWDEDEKDNDDDTENELSTGISLTLGYLPGLKVNLIPLTSQDKVENEILLIDEFVTNIQEYTYSVSASASPDAIIVFTDLKTDMRPVLQKMDCAFSSETIIVGDVGGRFLYRSNWAGCTMRELHTVPAAALLFVKDRDRAAGVGETKFLAALSNGLKPVGPTYKAACVKENPSERSTWLTARREYVNESLDGQTILGNICSEIGHHFHSVPLYVGVQKKRKCSIRKEKVKWLTFLEFHEVVGGDEEYLYLNNIGVKTGDSFQIYISDVDAALLSCNIISETFKHLKQNDSSSNQQTSTDVSGCSSKPLVFGGFVFSCIGRGESLFGRKNVDTMPFLENFPKATLAGTFCSGEIKRGKVDLPGQEHQEKEPVSCCVHFFSTVYLLCSYIPPVHQQD